MVVLKSKSFSEAMLKQRIITGVILGALIVLAVFKLPNQYLALIFALITIIGAWEWANLVGPPQILWKIIYILFLIIILFVTWVYAKPYHAHKIFLASALWWACVVIMLAMYDTKWLQAEWLKHVLVASGFIVLVPAWLALTVLHKQGPKLLMFLLALVWIADIAAYFVGKRFGKNKLAPNLSPGKSREGLFGALFASLLFAILGAYLFDIDKRLWIFFGILCVLTALISVVGDLYESLLKRSAGVKDSGRILPGHGGVLDRIDSLTAAAPGFVLGMLWVV